MPVSQPDLEIIETSIQTDTGFLYRAGVIDYSLVGLFVCLGVRYTITDVSCCFLYF